MKRFIVSAACIVLVFASGTALFAAQQRVVRVGAFNYYPAIFKDSDGAVKGFYVDALADLGRRENIRFEYVYGSWSEGLERIQSGEVDVLTSVAFTPERAEFLDYGVTPLLTVWGELYVPLASEIDGIREVQGKKIAVMKNDLNGRHFVDLVKKFNISCEFLVLPGFEDVFKAVAAKEVDAGVVSSTYGAARQKEYALRSTGVVFNPFDIFFATSKGKNLSLLALLESYLVNWRHQADSPYNSARQKWSHGSTGMVQVIPKWLKNASIVLGLLVAASVIFIILLKRQVRKATLDIKERERRFHHYIDNAPDGVFVVDENGRYLEVNLAASRITGYSREELLRMHLRDLLPPESLEPAQLAFKLMKQQRSSRCELEFLHKDGSQRWWSVDAVQLSESRYLGFFRDISDQKQLAEAQQFLAQCGYRYPDENFFESLACYLAGIMNMEYVCIDRLLGDGLAARTLAVYYDGKVEDNVEYTLKDTPCGDVVGNTICCFPEQVAQQFPLDQVLQDMRAESYIGVTLWNHSGQPIGLIAVIGRSPLKNRPLAETLMKLVAIRAAGELERMDVEAELRASEEKFRAMVETVPLAIHLTTGIEQVTQYVNPTMVKLFGYTREDIPTVEQWWPLAYPDEAYRRQVSEEWTRRVEQAIKSQSPIEPMEVVVTCRDGSKKNISWGYITLGDRSYSCGLDLTDRNIAEKELQKKNAEIEQFIYTVSHDLRSPLVTVKTFLGYLGQDLSSGDSERITKDMEFINTAAGRMETLLNELLEMSRVGRATTPPEQVTLQELVGEALNAVAGQTSTGNVEIRLCAADPILCGDRRRLLQIWQNLLDNALKYMGDQPSPRIELGVERRGAETVFTVQDNGIGITTAHHEKIFGIFEKLDRQTGGVGMGLTMVKRIVEIYDGRIWVESGGEGQGSRFCFTLPEAVGRGERELPCGGA